MTAFARAARIAVALHDPSDWHHRDEETFVKIFMPLALCALFAFASTAAVAQATSAQTNMQIMLDKIKADKKAVVAANMKLSDAEAAAFWPIYEEYQKDLAAVNERLGKLVTGYAKSYNDNTLTDEAASKLVAEALAIDRDETAMRTKYADKLAKVLPGKQVMRYMQIESKIRAAVRYQLAEAIPLVTTS